MISRLFVLAALASLANASMVDATTATPLQTSSILHYLQSVVFNKFAGSSVQFSYVPDSEDNGNAGNQSILVRSNPFSALIFVDDGLQFLEYSDPAGNRSDNAYFSADYSPSHSENDTHTVTYSPDQDKKTTNSENKLPDDLQVNDTTGDSWQEPTIPLVLDILPGATRGWTEHESIAETTANPEPSALAVISLSLAALEYVRRRRNAPSR
jgi:hypothetical protein